MKMALALLALAAFTPNAFAEEGAPAKTKLLCIVNTYDSNGDDFKSLFAAYQAIRADEVTEFFRSETMIYTAYFHSKVGGAGKADSMLVVEMKRRRSGRQVSAAAAAWPLGATGTHQVTAYSTEAEKGMKTMAGCHMEIE